MHTLAADSQSGHGRIRPAICRVIDRWADVSVTIQHSTNLVMIRREAPATPQENVALVVVGKNRLDPHLFERCAAHYVGRFLEHGWSITLLDLGFTADSPVPKPPKDSAPGPVVARVLAETERLRYVLFLTHSRHAINLSDSGNDLIVDQPATGSTRYPCVPIAQLRLSEAAAPDGWIDVFGCLCNPKARWPKELAKALNWPVRTVYPGYGIYFPVNDHYPKSAIPFTRVFSRSRYSQNGWAVWFPGSNRPVRVSEPGESARRYDKRFDYVERVLVSVLSVGLERIRDFRKLRALAAMQDTNGNSVVGSNVARYGRVARLFCKFRSDENRHEGRRHAP
jgi:hypothetical protein